MFWHPKTIQNIASYSVFSFLSVFPLPEAYQKDPKFHVNTLCKLRHPKIVEKSRKHHLILVSVRNRFSPPSPPAKADIATAILTNVIEHLVWLKSTPRSTPSPPFRGVGGFGVVISSGGMIIPNLSKNKYRSKPSLLSHDGSMYGNIYLHLGDFWGKCW